MSSQPTLFDSFYWKLMLSSPQAAAVPAEQASHGRRPSMFGEGFAATAMRHQSNDGSGPTWERLTAQLQGLQERLDRIESLLEGLIQQRTVKDWYTIAEAAEILGKAEFTVREWCRLDRVHAQKRACGRGRAREWMIAHDELLRIQNEGLLPQPTISTRLR